MQDLDEIINEATEAREIKRAISVKMGRQGFSAAQICQVLNVSPQYVSKWKGQYEAEGAVALRLGQRGSEGYPSEGQRQEIVQWIGGHETVTVEAVRDYVEERYGVVYQSKQSYYEFLEAGGLSYHRSEKVSPKRDEAQVLARREELKKKLAAHREEIERGELVVLVEDECHLVWGDVCGMGWGKRNTPIAVPMTNERPRQTYYGAINLLTHEVHLQDGEAGDGEHTVAYLRWCQSLYPEKKLLVLWDGASYHRSTEMQTFLAHENAGLPEEDWKVTCLLVAPHAPQQNPTEDLWLKGKTPLRKHFAVNKTFAQVKHCFSAFLRTLSFDSIKFTWYWSTPQMI
jgi:transposase